MTTLKAKKQGIDHAILFINELSQFVKENWETLFLGATRLGCEIPSDYYAPERMQIGGTRLHRSIGVKYADGWKYSGLVGATEKQLKQTVADVQTLLDAAAEERKIGVKLKIENI